MHAIVRDAGGKLVIKIESSAIRPYRGVAYWGNRRMTIECIVARRDPILAFGLVPWISHFVVLRGRLPNGERKYVAITGGQGLASGMKVLPPARNGLCGATTYGWEYPRDAAVGYLVVT